MTIVEDKTGKIKSASMETSKKQTQAPSTSDKSAKDKKAVKDNNEKNITASSGLSRKRASTTADKNTLKDIKAGYTKNLVSKFFFHFH